MKWKTKAEPRPGEIRFVKRFAFFPVALNTDNTVWLEMYFVQQGYSPERGMRVAGWYDVAFLEKWAGF